MNLVAAEGHPPEVMDLAFGIEALALAGPAGTVLANTGDWTLFATVVVAVLGVIDQLLYPGARMGAFSIVDMIISLALVLPGIAVSVRRLHDIDRTGWWVLLGLTAIGVLVLIYWACQRGTIGQNRFGPDPMPALATGSARATTSTS